MAGAASLGLTLKSPQRIRAVAVGANALVLGLKEAAAFEPWVRAAKLGAGLGETFAATASLMPLPGKGRLLVGAWAMGDTPQAAMDGRCLVVWRNREAQSLLARLVSDKPLVDGGAMNAVPARTMPRL